MACWRRARDELGEIARRCREQGHQYRHPKKPGEAWSASRAAERARRPPSRGSASLDFTTAMAGPTASMLLADFGAEVVKVEPPEGESSRRWGSARFGERGDTSGLFARAQPQQARHHAST